MRVIPYTQLNQSHLPNHELPSNCKISYYTYIKEARVNKEDYKKRHERVRNRDTKNISVIHR